MGIKNQIFSISGVAVLATLMVHAGFTIYSYNHKLIWSYQHQGSSEIDENEIKIELVDEELTTNTEELEEEFLAEQVSNQSQDVNDTREVDNENYTFNSKALDDEIRDKVASYTQQYFKDAASELNLDELPDFNPEDIEVQGYEEGLELNSGKKSDAENVTVSYSLPEGRFFRKEPRKPNYLCKGSGKVHINLTIDPIGNISVSYDPAKSSGASDCHVENAIRYAKTLMVTRKNNVPREQSGWIVYTFVGQ